MSKLDAKRPLSPREEAVLRALLQTASLTEATAIAGVSRSTVQRALADPIFREALAEAQSQLRETILRQVVVAARRAVEVVIEVMNSKAPSATRLRAANTALDVFVKTADLSDLLARLAKLEAQMEANHEAVK